MDRLLITKRPLSIDAAFKSVARPDCGGICVFLGTVRNHHDGRRVRRIRYSAFEEMALRTFREMAAEARQRFGVRAVYIAHRTGTLRFTEPSVICAAAAVHRAEAFKAARWIIDRLKKISPIWKEEFYSRGKRWIGEPTSSFRAGRPSGA